MRYRILPYVKLFILLLAVGCTNCAVPDEVDVEGDAAFKADATDTLVLNPTILGHELIDIYIAWPPADGAAYYGVAVDLVRTTQAGVMRIPVHAPVTKQDTSRNEVVNVGNLFEALGTFDDNEAGVHTLHLDVKVLQCAGAHDVACMWGPQQPVHARTLPPFATFVRPLPHARLRQPGALDHRALEHVASATKHCAHILFVLEGTLGENRAYPNGVGGFLQASREVARANNEPNVDCIVGTAYNTPDRDTPNYLASTALAGKAFTPVWDAVVGKASRAWDAYAHSKGAAAVLSAFLPARVDALKRHPSARLYALGVPELAGLATLDRVQRRAYDHGVVFAYQVDGAGPRVALFNWSNDPVNAINTTIDLGVAGLFFNPDLHDYNPLFYDERLAWHRRKFIEQAGGTRIGGRPGGA